MSGLTPDEQKFFETGELPEALAGAPAPSPAPAPDPLAHQALSAPAPAPAPAPTPAPAPAPTAAPAPVDPPSSEFLQRSLVAAQQRAAELEAHIRFAQAQQQNQPDPGPDPSVDPIGALLHQQAELQKQILALQQGYVQSQQQTQQLTQLQAFQQQVVQLKTQFAAQTPDYDAAITHLRNARVADLRAFGATDQQILQQIAQEEFAIAEAAIAGGKNPAQVVYEMSKRHGYVPQAAPAPGAAPAPAPATATSLEAIQRAQAAAKNLPVAPAADPEITLENLRNASETDLNKMVLDPKLWNKLTGADEYPL